MNNRITVQLLESDKEIERLVRKELAEELNRQMSRVNLFSLKDAFGKEMTEVYIRSPIGQSLISGELSGHFGFYKGTGEGILRSILRVISEEIVVEFRPVKNRGEDFTGGFTFKIIEASYSRILNLEEAIVLNEKGSDGYGGPASIEVLPWLDWFLTKGSIVILQDYSINLGNFPAGISRSTKALMQPIGKKGSSGTPWGVPTHVDGDRASGTKEDNWLTRTLDEKTIGDIIEKALEGVLV